MYYGKLKAKMRRCGVTQKVLEEKIDICEGGMTRKMNGKTKWTWDDVLKICDALGVDNPRDLFEEGEG